MKNLHGKKYRKCAKISTKSCPKLIVLLRNNIHRVRKLFNAGYLVSKNPTTPFTAYKIKIDELVVEVRHIIIKNFSFFKFFSQSGKTSKIEVPEATLCLKRHRNLLSSTNVLLDYYYFVLTFIQTLKRQNVVCERKATLIGKVADDNVISPGSTLLSIGCPSPIRLVRLGRPRP
jgi:hypothetical protein